jgi:hypothetical protein
MIKLPKQLKIGGITYKIELAPMGDDLGQTDFRTSLIRVNEALNDEQKLAAFIHECFHAINPQLTEEQVDYLALSVNQILVDNKLI